MRPTCTLISMTVPNLLSALVVVAATTATAEDRPAIRLYESGESLTLRAADLTEAAVKHTPNGQPILTIDFGGPDDENIHTFTSGIVGGRIVGVFDGVAWMTDIRIPEPVPGGPSQISGVDKAAAEAFVAKLDSLRADPAARDTPMIFMFEQRATIDIMRDDIVDVAIDNGTVTVCLDPSTLLALEELDEPDRGVWRLTLADRIIDDWDYQANEQECPLHLHGVDAATLSEAGLGG
ncbi:hypothetical protein [Bauldia sp.]|uniref:hypothetical protein n=1 Tax=Bauldia sp. TaxID=2575872 RepID=UPI003BAA95B7